jgi:Ser/Thr protein kinase RdoA (MazF antagonist)
VDLSYSRCQFEYEILDEARGECLTRRDDSDAILGLLRLLGAMAARIHLQRLRGFGWFTLGPMRGARDVADVELRGSDARWGDYVERNLERHVDYCRRIDAIADEEQRRILALFTEHAHLWDDAPSALLHGDLGNHNVFTDGERITAIIDWEDCLVGDPVYDIAFWATFHPEPRHAAFLDGYRAVAALPPDFALRFWLYFLRVSLAKTVHRHRFGYSDRPGRPPASRRIQLSLERLETS